MDPGSGLNLQLVNSTAPVKEAQLFIQSVFGGTVSPNPLPTPTGVADVNFGGNLNSYVDYTGDIGFGVVSFNNG